jgi:hypothetical protein
MATQPGRDQVGAKGVPRADRALLHQRPRVARGRQGGAGPRESGVTPREEANLHPARGGSDESSEDGIRNKAMAHDRRKGFAGAARPGTARAPAPEPPEEVASQKPPEVQTQAPPGNSPGSPRQPAPEAPPRPPPEAPLPAPGESPAPPPEAPPSEPPGAPPAVPPNRLPSRLPSRLPVPEAPRGTRWTKKVPGFQAGDFIHLHRHGAIVLRGGARQGPCWMTLSPGHGVSRRRPRLSFAG